MAPGGEAVSPLHIPAWRNSPPVAVGRGHRPAHVRRQRRQGARPGGGWSGRPRAVRLPRRARVDRGRRRHRPRRPPARGAAATPATSATWWSSRTGAEAGAAVRAVWRRRRRGGPSPRQPGAGGEGGPEWSSAPAASWAGRWPRWPTCSIWAWPWWRGAWRPASAAVPRRGPGRARGPGPVGLLPRDRAPPRRPRPPHPPGGGGSGGMAGPRSRCGGGGDPGLAVRPPSPWSAGPGCGPSPCARRAAWPGPDGGVGGRRCPSPTPRTCAFACRRPTATPTVRRRPTTSWPTWNGAAVSVACASLPRRWASHQQAGAEGRTGEP